MLVIPIFRTYHEGLAFLAVLREFAKEINFVVKKTIRTASFSTLVMYISDFCSTPKYFWQTSRNPQSIKSLAS
jgi:hypothetical protein